MAANPPESRILPRNVGWPWRHGPALNPPDDLFCIKICPLNPGDHMLSQKLLVDVGTDPFGGGNNRSVPKSARPTLVLLTFDPFHPFAMASGSHCLAAFSHWKPCFCCCWGPCKSTFVAVPCRALSDQLAANNLHGEWEPAHSHLHHRLDRRLVDFAHLAPHSLPAVAYDWSPHLLLSGQLYMFVSYKLVKL
jgi:hypothetical protein